jgi:hypothetical protein
MVANLLRLATICLKKLPIPHFFGIGSFFLTFVQLVSAPGFINQVHHSQIGMPTNHPGTCKSHYYSYLFPLFWFITMNWAFRTNRLVFPKNTVLKSGIAILNKRFTILTDLIIRRMILLAKHTDHVVYRFFLPVNPAIFHCLSKEFFKEIK